MHKSFRLPWEQKPLSNHSLITLLLNVITNNDFKTLDYDSFVLSHVRIVAPNEMEY